MVKIACQTIVFGNPVIKDTLAEIAETVKKIGYDGYIGFEYFPVGDSLSGLKRMREYLPK